MGDHTGSNFAIKKPVFRIIIQQSALFSKYTLLETSLLNNAGKILNHFTCTLAVTSQVQL